MALQTTVYMQRKLTTLPGSRKSAHPSGCDVPAAHAMPTSSLRVRPSLQQGLIPRPILPPSPWRPFPPSAIAPLPEPRRCCICLVLVCKSHSGSLDGPAEEEAILLCACKAGAGLCTSLAAGAGLCNGSARTFVRAPTNPPRMGGGGRGRQS